MALVLLAAWGFVLRQGMKPAPPHKDPELLTVEAGEAAVLHRHILFVQQPGILDVVLDNPEGVKGRIRSGPPQRRSVTAPVELRVSPRLALDAARAVEQAVDGSKRQLLFFPIHASETRILHIEFETAAPLGIRARFRSGLLATPSEGGGV